MTMEMGNEIKRGEIYFIDLPEIEGSIQYGKRPCYISSTDVNNRYSRIINVIPLTSNLKKVYPMHVLVKKECGLNKDSYALTEQLMPVMKNRILYKLGECDEVTIRKIEEGIKLQQGIKENQNNKKINFDLKHVQNSIEMIREWENYIIENNISENDFIYKNTKLQIDIISQYCDSCNENINKYYKPMIDFNFNTKAVIKYA